MLPARPPSTQWEPLTFPEVPGSAAWCWYFPNNSPQVVSVIIPVAEAGRLGRILTARKVVAALGVPQEFLAGWQIAGTSIDAQRGANPLLDQPIPVAPDRDQELTVWLLPPAGIQPMPGATPMPVAMPVNTSVANSMTNGTSVPANVDRLYAAMEADWHAIEKLERQLAAVTKQLNGLAGKLQSLNRDLSPHERLAADNNDVKDWSEARRFLRDAASQISKQVRAFDIGTVSSAGNRNRFSDIYENHVKTRKPFDGMHAVAAEFEAHRKTCQNLLQQSSAALSAAQRDGEGRARSVLSRISAKARSRR